MGELEIMNSQWQSVASYFGEECNAVPYTPNYVLLAEILFLLFSTPPTPIYFLESASCILFLFLPHSLSLLSNYSYVLREAHLTV